MVHKLHGYNFEKEVLQSKEPVLVDFYADWCGPCKMMSPVVDRLSDIYAGRLTVGKVNVDEEKLLAGDYGIRSIPSFLLFRDGQVVDSVTGGVPSSMLERMIERQVA